MPRECPRVARDPGARIGQAVAGAASRTEGTADPRGEKLRVAAWRTRRPHRSQLSQLSHAGKLPDLSPGGGAARRAGTLSCGPGTRAGGPDRTADAGESYGRMEDATRIGCGVDAALL